MSKGAAFLCGFALAAAGAACGWWFLVKPRLEAGDERVAAAERAAARSKRMAADREVWAEAERRRRLEMEDEIGVIRRTGGGVPPPPAAGGTSGGHGTPTTAVPDPTGGQLAPELWDWNKRSMEIQFLSRFAGGLIANERFKLLVRACKAHREEDVGNLSRAVEVPGYPSDQLFVLVTLLWELGDERAVPSLLIAWKNAADERRLLADLPAEDPKAVSAERLRTAIVRALANLEGSAQTDLFRTVWNDPASPADLRMQAIHGLARRRDALAMNLVRNGADPPVPGLRKQALDTLHLDAMNSGFKETALVADFCKALLSADGGKQEQLCLLVLEGFHSPESVPALEAFAEKAGTSELAARARELANAIKAGKPRPENAGVPPAKPDQPKPEQPK